MVSGRLHQCAIHVAACNARRGPGNEEEGMAGERLRAMAEDWSPWRAVAARMLWAYYHVAKAREGIR